MLLENAIELVVLQVVEGKSPPKSQDLGQFHCPACRVKLHGHGWRRRYFINDAFESLQIWIHRKLCPCCRRPYTLLPSYLLAFKLFALKTITRDDLGRYSQKSKPSTFLAKMIFNRYRNAA